MRVGRLAFGLGEEGGEDAVRLGVPRLLLRHHRRQCNECATALRLGTVQSHQMLRRFTCGGPKRPAYQAIEELGRVIGPVLDHLNLYGRFELDMARHLDLGQEPSSMP
nr:Tn3 family transposase [Thermomonospora echinospora]